MGDRLKRTWKREVIAHMTADDLRMTYERQFFRPPHLVRLMLGTIYHLHIHAYGCCRGQAGVEARNREIHGTNLGRPPVGSSEVVSRGMSDLLSLPGNTLSRFGQLCDLQH